MSRYDDIDAIITALGGSATADEVEYALRDYPDREVRTVLAERAAAGGAFNGGTITEPLIIDLTAGGEATGFKLLLPGSFAYDNRPFEIKVGTTTILAQDTSGNVTTGGNDFSTGGGTAKLRTAVFQTGLGETVHRFSTTGIKFFSPDVEVAQAAAIPAAAGGGTVDAEARSALNALLVAMRAYGLIAT